MATVKKRMAWEHFSHGADIGVRGSGESIEEAFEQAALALTAVVGEISRVEQRQSVEVHCEAPDVELLFVSWLNAIIYEMAVRRMLFSAFRVVISGGTVRGTLQGELADPERHQIGVEVKGATVTELKVRRGPDGRWVAQCVVDV